MGQLDMRAISLYSRDSRQEGFKRLKDGQYYSFCYYDAIRVEQAGGGFPAGDARQLRHSLLSAYEAAAEYPGRQSVDTADGEAPEPYASHQFLLALADVREEGGDAGGGCCYTAAEIGDFWKDAGYPVFFVTMITLKDNRRLEDALAEIRRIFPKGKHLAYLTFDHCDILLFYRDSGFSDYTDRIFRLNYGTDLLEDSITLFSFAVEHMDQIQTGERFDVYLRFGVRDYHGAKAFTGRYEKNDETVSVGRLLGRNDVGLWKREADIVWLGGLMREALEPSVRWYTTYELSILIRRPDGERTWPPLEAPLPEDGEASAPEDGGAAGSGAAAMMERALEGFLEAYADNSMGLEPDPVWIRWLKKTSALAAALYENRLAADFGTCLVPQFLDMFAYMGRLLQNRRLTNADIEDIRKIFSVFFSSTSILMDSINHSSRQFVQVPSFSSVSFEMPPKLMAYYTALAHRLIEVFRDGEETYGVAFCPEFVQTLEVTSYADQEISKDEWLAISVDERSLYTMRLTTQTIGHEISHFVGNGNRCREDRERLSIKAALASLLERLLFQVGNSLGTLCGDAATFRGEIRWEEVSACTDELWDMLRRICLPEWSEEGHYSRQVRKRIVNLPNVILSVPALCGVIEAWLCRTLLDRADRKEAVVLLWRHFAREMEGPERGAESDAERESMEAAFQAMAPVYRSMAGDTVRAELLQALERQSKYNRAVEAHEEKPLYRRDPPWVSADHICYMFSEAFADLQMVLLFDLEWEDYCALLMQDGERLLAEDCPPRMLAVAKALTEIGKWRAEDIRSDGCAEENGGVCRIGDAVRLSLREDAVRLQELGFEMNLTVYLVEYLKLCCEKIRAALEKKQAAVDELREIHGLLSEGSSVCELKTGLIRFIGNYRAGLERGYSRHT